MTETQTTSQLLMIRPVRFAGNAQTADSNFFQRLGLGDAEAQQRALVEFNGLVAGLRAVGVQVHLFDDTPEPHTPDSIFPNNWVSFHADGSVVLYPMMAVNRRLERRIDILQRLSSDMGFRIERVVDLTPHERDDKFLEGTGSVVLDRVSRLAYACVSPRTDLDALGDFAQQLDYEPITFEAFDREGLPIYHTNVVMSIGTHFAVICTAAIAAHEQAGVMHALLESDKSIIEISMEQMHAFAGNMLEVRDTDNKLHLVMSQTAFDCLSSAQRHELETLSGPFVVAAIPTIETLGGGSVRCMLAEVCLPRR